MRVSRPFSTRILSLILLTALLLVSTYEYLPNRQNFTAHWNSPNSSKAPSISSVTDIFDHPPLNSDAIKSICTTTQWNPNLVFTCSNSGGGIGNLRNSFLNCVRYAISAGASLTLPRIIERDPGDIAHIWDRERVDFSYIFDTEHFLESLELSCPQLRVWNRTEDIPYREKAVFLEPEKIGGSMTPEGLEFPEKWRDYFYAWLAENADVRKPVVVDLGRSYLQYPIYSDPEMFALDFGRILKFRKDARELATSVLRNMTVRFEMDVDPWAPVWENAFFGTHLRTERDSQQGWPVDQYEYSKYSTQAGFYLKQAVSSGLKIIYLASGEKKDVRQFSADARALNLTVITKHELLTRDDLVQLEKFSFDQQALVDFLVLLKSSDFAGVGHSSFAWNIALWRHMFAKQREHLKGPQLMSDDLSQVYGTVNQYMEYASCLWP